MLDDFDGKPFHWNPTPVGQLPEKVSEARLLPQRHGMNIDVYAKLRWQFFGLRADRFKARAIHRRFDPLAPDIIEQYVGPFKVGAFRSSYQGFQSANLM